MTTYQTAPTSQAAAFAQRLASLDARIAELEREPSRAYTWHNFTLASANWTINAQPQWRREGDRIWLRGTITRTTTVFTPGGSIVTGLGTGTQPPAPQQKTSNAQVAASGGTPLTIHLIADATTDVIRTSGLGPTLAIGDIVELDGFNYV